MPRVRIPTPQVGTAPLPMPTPIRRDTSGYEALAGATEQVARATQAIAEQAQDEADAGQLLEGFARLGKTREEIAARLLATEGRAALEVDLPQQGSDELHRAAQEIESSLPSDRVKARFQKLIVDQDLGLRGDLTSHVLQQDRVYRQQAYQGAVSSAVDLGVQAAATAPAGQAAESTELASARGNLLGAVDLRFRYAPPETLTAERTAALTQLHAGAVDRLIADQRPADAERYLTRWQGEMDPAAVGKLELGLRASAKKATAAGLALQIVQSSRDEQNPGRVDPGKAYEKLDAAFAPGGQFSATPDFYFEAQSLLARTISDQNATAKVAFDRVAGTAIGQYLALDKSGQPHPSFANVTPQARADLEATGKDGQELLRQMLDWDRSAESQRRSARNQPTDEEAARAFAIERSIAVNLGAWRAMSGADQMAVLAGRAAVPGEPQAPVVAVSPRDVPGLSSKIADASKGEQTRYITDPDKLAFEVAEEVYPNLRRYASNQAGIPVGEARNAVRALSDKVAEFVNAEKKRTGKEPSQAEIRQEAVRLMTTVEVQRKFIGIPRTKKTPRVLAEQAGEPFTISEKQPRAFTQPPAVAPAPPPGTPADWIPYRNEKTGEVRYNAPGKAKGDWKELR